MSPELESLVTLQDIETRAAEAARRIAETPGEIAALDAKLSAARDALAAARQAATDNQSARRALDQDLLSAQQRLSKYKEQLMAVKTNDEYHAMQHQIAAAGAEVGRVEEAILINMLQADECAAAAKGAEAALKTAEAQVARERAAIEADAAERRKVIEETGRARDEVLPRISRQTAEMFQRVLKSRQGIAVAQAVGGMCTICHVRLRPQVYNTVLRNDQIVQCDTCQRILYFPGVHERSAAGQAAADAATTRQNDFERPSS